MKRHTLTLLFMVAASMIAMSSSNCSAKTGRLPNSVAKSRYVAKLANLTELRLEKTKVTDEGLKHIAGLTNLKTLYLPMGITQESLNQLQSVLPNCLISRY